LQLRQNRNLLDDILDLIFSALDVDDFDGDSLAGALVDAGTKSALETRETKGESRAGQHQRQTYPL